MHGANTLPHTKLSLQELMKNGESMFDITEAFKQNTDLELCNQELQVIPFLS